MAVVARDMRSHIQAFDFATIFIEDLHWDRYRGRGDIYATVDDHTYTLTPIAQKSGVVAYLCDHDETGAVPTSTNRRKVERQVAKVVQEHIIVYTDAVKMMQVWQWVWRQEGKPTSVNEQTYHVTQSGTALAQKLEPLIIRLDEEVTVLDVVRRINDGLRKERVTKQFYERFQQEHDVFLNFIDGMGHEADRKWYAALMLNRLMFVYFIQRQGFLDNDPNYLRTRLNMDRNTPFLSFYKYFLRHLFHEGLSKKPAERQPHLERLLGRIPYLNGGLFDVHTLESSYPDIDIADKAFERIFDFFDIYDWHLDNRPLSKDNEINPDVLGYIFEKYINQRQMGAYYTKEDVTGYISQNAIIPHLFDAAQRKCPIAFDTDGYVWRLLRDNPDLYIYGDVRKGVDVPLPTDIAIGQSDPLRRDRWNHLADPAYALVAQRDNGPEQITETWRECVVRRERYQRLREKIEAGSVISVDDLVVDNLDIRQFAQDVVANCEGADLLWAFYQAIERITVLDLTCGSGAFNFAALNVLESLYEVCLDRMQGFVDDADRADAPRTQDGHALVHRKYDNFRAVLARVANHPNRRYFIYKSIIMNNLYGVDIMEEAVEICKLRLFLKLTSQVDDVTQLEPLPDIDFNIRTGNTLIGFADYAEVQKAVLGGIQGRMDFSGDMARIDTKAQNADKNFQRFRDLQGDRTTSTATIKGAKADLRYALTGLRDELDRYLATEYGIDVTNAEAYNHWRRTHQPFHWFVEFYRIITDGGFDTIIGNPPYVEYRVVKSTYKLPARQYKSEKAENLYAFCMERAAKLLSSPGRFGMIVPAGVLGLDETSPLREVLLERFEQSVCSTYAIRPSRLFDGVDQRLCIYLAHGQPKAAPVILTTTYHHWYSEERPALFTTLAYNPSFMHPRLQRIPQLGNADASDILTKIEAKSARTVESYYAKGRSGYLMHYHRSPRYWIRAMDFEQYFKSATKTRSVHHFRDLYFVDEVEAKVVRAILRAC